MSDGRVATDAPSPSTLHDPSLRREAQRAAVWIGMIGLAALAVLLAQTLLIIFGGIVFAALLDGGTRLLGRVLPLPRGARLAIVCLAAIAFVGGVFYLTGVEIAAQAQALSATLSYQAGRVNDWIASVGLMPGREDLAGLVQQAVGSVGQLTYAVTTVFSALATITIMAVIGLFIAIEPRIYDRGVQWLVPRGNRRAFAVTLGKMASTLRRLLAGRLFGMAFEGVLTWVALSIGGVPMALLLGILSGLLAFIPNIGAFVTGILMLAVGFAAGTDTGLWALGTYCVVQIFDGYVVVPMVAKKTVDLPPATTLSAQILMSAVFGILGLALADPATALVKVALERGAGEPDPVE